MCGVDLPLTTHHSPLTCLDLIALAPAAAPAPAETAPAAITAAAAPAETTTAAATVVLHAGGPH